MILLHFAITKLQLKKLVRIMKSRKLPLYRDKTDEETQKLVSEYIIDLYDPSRNIKLFSAAKEKRLHEYALRNPYYTELITQFSNEKRISDMYETHHLYHLQIRWLIRNYALPKKVLIVEFMSLFDIQLKSKIELKILKYKIFNLKTYLERQGIFKHYSIYKTFHLHEVYYGLLYKDYSDQFKEYLLKNPKRAIQFHRIYTSVFQLYDDILEDKDKKTMTKSLSEFGRVKDYELGDKIKKYKKTELQKEKMHDHGAPKNIKLTTTKR